LITTFTLFLSLHQLVQAVCIEESQPLAHNCKPLPVLNAENIVDFQLPTAIGLNRLELLKRLKVPQFDDKPLVYCAAKRGIRYEAPKFQNVIDVAELAIQV